PVMRPRVVPPAEVHPQLGRRYRCHGSVEDLDVEPYILPEFAEGSIGELAMPRHREVGTVKLKSEACGCDRHVLTFHRCGVSTQKGLLAVVVGVAEEHRNEPWRCRSDERPFGIDALKSRAKVLEVRRDCLVVLRRDRPVARGPALV